MIDLLELGSVVTKTSSVELAGVAVDHSRRY